jgi:hypothetical protein
MLGQIAFIYEKCLDVILSGVKNPEELPLFPLLNKKGIKLVVDPWLSSG